MGISSTFKLSPDNRQIRRCIFLWQGCSFSGKDGIFKRCWAGYSWIGSLHNIDISTGYHDGVDHFGTTTTPVALSCFIFCKTARMQLKGGEQ